MTKPETSVHILQQQFVIRASSLFRHSSFVVCHFSHVKVSEEFRTQRQRHPDDACPSLVQPLSRQ